MQRRKAMAAETRKANEAIHDPSGLSYLDVISFCKSTHALAIVERAKKCKPRIVGGPYNVTITDEKISRYLALARASAASRGEPHEFSVAVVRISVLPESAVPKWKSFLQWVNS